LASGESSSGSRAAAAEIVVRSTVIGTVRPAIEEISPTRKSSRALEPRRAAAVSSSCCLVGSSRWCRR
jgi:hypothetical protein